MKKTAIFVINLVILISCFIFIPITASAEVSADQYEFTDCVLHLKYGDFDADFFRNFAEKTSVTAITADDGVSFVGSFAGIYDASNDYHGAFSYYSYCATIDFSKVDTSRVNNMSYMFYFLGNLTSLDVSGFDTSNVTDMSFMFYNCNSLTSLDLTGFDTSNVSNMSFMFYNCGYLTSLDVSGFDTSNVMDMSYMFYYCTHLTSLDVSGFETSNVTDMSYMFCMCPSLTSLDVSGFNTSNVTDMFSMFDNCRSLTSLDVSWFNTSNVTDMRRMFQTCQSLTNLDVSGFDTSNVTNMYCMFDGCRSLTSLDVSGFDTSNVTDMGGMFSGCRSLTSLDVSWFNTSNVTDMRHMFQTCQSLTNLDVSGFDTSNVTDMGGMFSGCSSVTSLDVSGFDTSNVTDMRYMFYNCSSLKRLDVSGFGTSNVTDMGGMFYNCSSLTSLDLSGFDTSNVYDMGYMFHQCSNLTSLDLSDYDTSNVTSMYCMFYNCSSLTSLDVSGFDTSNITDMIYMFSGCSSLTSLDVSGFDTSNVTSMGGMFYGCNSLSKIQMPAGLTVQAKMELNNGKQTDNGYSGWTKRDSSVKVSGTGRYAEFVSEGGEYVWLEGVPEVNEFHFSSDLLPNGKYTFDYDDSWFFNNSCDGHIKEKNTIWLSQDTQSLLEMSIRVAVAAFGGDSHTDSKNIKDLFEKIGYDKIDIDDHYPLPEDNSIGYVIGSKNIDNNGEEATVICVAIRGGGYGNEWAGNFYVGSGKRHFGFNLAAVEVVSGIQAYIEDNKESMTDNIKIWVSGYSRAAAVANLVGFFLDEGKKIPQVKPENVFAFCFECPQTTIDQNAASSKYNNIYYIVNPIDLVTKLAPSIWDYTRYGVPLFLPSREKDYSTYTSQKNEMLLTYADLLAYNGFADAYSVALSYGTEKKNQEYLLNELVSYLGALFQTPQKFSSNFQTAVQDFARTYLGNIKPSPKESNAALKNFCDKFIEMVAQSSLLDISNAAIVNKFYKGELLKAIYLFYDLEKVDEWPNVMLAHYPELCLAWIDSMNNYNSGICRSAFLNCPVDINVYDSKGKLVGSIINDEPIEIEDGIISYIDIDGQKVFILPGDEEFSVEVISTGSGELTYTVKEYDYNSGHELEVVSYCQIPIEQGDTFAGVVENLIQVDNPEYPLYRDGQELEATVTQSDEEIVNYTVTVETEGNGTVAGGGIYTAGEYSKMWVVEGADSFIGWFKDDELLSTELEYRVPVLSDVTIKAVFKSDVIPGDVDNNGVVDSDDAIYLLYYTFLPDQFPVNQNCDFDGSGVVDSDDAIYLLYYTFLPDMFPLN